MKDHVAMMTASDVLCPNFHWRLNDNFSDCILTASHWPYYVFKWNLLFIYDFLEHGYFKSYISTFHAQTRQLHRLHLSVLRMSSIGATVQ